MAEKHEKKAAVMDEPVSGSDLMTMFQALIAKVGTPAPSGVPVEQFAELLQTVKKTMKPENETHPGISAFSYPEGDVARPKPTLTRRTFVVGARMSEESLTPTEIELFNAITQSCEAREGRWKARVVKNGTADELHITFPHKEISDRMDLPKPGLVCILRELIGGKAAADPEALFARVAELEAKLAVLTAA